MCPGRKNPLFTEEGILAAIEGNWAAIEAGVKPAVVYRPVYQPYREHTKYTGFMRLYVHYLYILGKIEKREYPPRMTPQMRKDLMQFEKLRSHFSFMRDNDIATPEDMKAYQRKAEETLLGLMKRRTVLNVRKKRRRKLYTALADAESLAGAQKPYEKGVLGLEDAVARYMEAVAVLEKGGMSREALAREKADLYNQLAQLNREIRSVRKKLKMCTEILKKMPNMEKNIRRIELKREKHRKPQVSR